MNTNKIAILNWLLWVQKVSPELYALFKIKHPDIVNALDDSRLGFWGAINWGTVLDVGTKFVQTAVPIYQQQKQFKQQLELAKVQAATPQWMNAPTPPAPQYVPQAVPVSTPSTNVTPAVTPQGQQILEIRIDKGQIQQVKQEAEKVKTDYTKYLPLMLGAGIVLLMMRS